MDGTDRSTDRSDGQDSSARPIETPRAHEDAQGDNGKGSRELSPARSARSPSPGAAAGDNDGDGGSGSASGKRRKVTRSRAGCLTCRKRRKLCDMEKPTCKTCERLQLECNWPANVPGEASRTDSNRPRKRYDSTSTPALPSLTPRGSGSGTPNLPRPVASLLNAQTPLPPLLPSSSTFHAMPSRASNSNGPWTPVSSIGSTSQGQGHGPGNRTMDDFLNIFGTSATTGLTPAASPAVHDGRVGLLQQPIHTRGPLNAPLVGGGHGSGNLTADAHALGMMGTITPGAADGTDPGGVGHVDMGMFDGMNFDDEMLQLWAADLFNIKDPPNNPWDSLSSILAPRPDGTPIPAPFGGPPTIAELAFTQQDNAESGLGSASASASASASGSRSGPAASIAHSPVNSRPHLQSDAPHKPLLAHYQDSLSKLVACIPEDSINGFDAFTTLASATASSPAGKGLHLATLAWAGRHMSNMGQVKYEALSERLGEQARDIVFGILGSMTSKQRRGEESGLGETDAMTLLGGTLMLVQFKICRGDVWGFTTYHDYLTDLSARLFGTGEKVAPFPSDSLMYSFFENLIFHDMLSTFIMQDRGPMVSSETLEALANVMLEGPNTLTGTTFRVFVISHQMAKLIRDGRKQRLTSWNDENLIDTVSTAGGLERELELEKERYQQLVNAKPAAFAPWQYMHEGFRVAATISVRSFILGAPPCSIGVRLLVRQSLSLLETMYEQDLPGFCSAHWQLFITALCATPSAAPGKEEQIDDRDRVERLYDSVLSDLGFKNVARSRQVVHEVWNRNQNGQVTVDWLDIIQEWEWELYIV